LWLKDGISPYSIQHFLGVNKSRKLISIERDEADMSERLDHEKDLNILRLLLIIAGIILIPSAFLADIFGFGEAGSFGIGQILLILLGFLIILIGFLGKSFVNFYHGMAVILLNTVIFLGILELGAIVITQLGFIPTNNDIADSKYLELPYYREKDWSEAYWHERRQAGGFQYQPYVVWRHRQFEGTYVNVNRDGIRFTPGADCSSKSFTVYMYGGSSMWGWGSPDWGTIEAYLQAGLDEIVEGPVCVINMGEDAYVSTQSMISLILQLQKGKVPNVVIFLDGVNDVEIAYASGEPGAHAMLADISARFEGSGNHLQNWLRSTSLFWLTKIITQKVGVYDVLLEQYQGAHTKNTNDINELARAIIENYIANYYIVNRLEGKYGYQSYFFWQPHIAVGKKKLTSHELDIRSEIDEPLVQLANQAYNYLNEVNSEHENLFNIADAFNDQEDQIWIDSWGHVTPEGNKLIAEEILNIMRDLIVIEKE
jgi:hypothetical protein